MAKSKKTKGNTTTYLPIYERKNNPETNRDATYLYYSTAARNYSAVFGGTEQGEVVNSMPRFQTDGDPLTWVQGQQWWRAGTWEGEEGKRQPKWEPINHTAFFDPKSDWNAKWKTTEAHPASTHYPKKKWNYVTEIYEWQNSPFEEWKPSPVAHREASVDHLGFARMWMDNRYKSVASLGKVLRWKRTKVVERRNIVNRWLAKVDGYDLELPSKITMTDNEEEKFLAQQAAVPPTEEQLAELLGWLKPDKSAAK
jgi:hypothetical protein